MTSSPSYSTEGEPHESLDAVLPEGYRQQTTPPAPAGERPVPVDQVAIRKLGGFTFVSPQQWNRFDKDTRKRLIQANEVIFLSHGAEVPLRAALLWLKSLD